MVDSSRRSFLIGIGAVAGAAAGVALGRLFGLGQTDAGTLVPEALVTQPPLPSAVPPESSTTSVPTTTTTEAATSTSLAPETVPPETSATAAEATAALTLICKSSWGARPLAGELDSHTIERLTVHHTAVVLESNAQAPARARQHQRFHQDSGWADLAYHYLVDGNGNIYEGRPFDAPGDTFTNYEPAGHFLVCCEGNFDQQEIPEAQRYALAGMLAWGSQRFGVSADTIAGHRDYASTTCPGSALYPLIADGSLQATVQELIDGGGVELITVCDEEGDAFVAAIEAGTA